MYAFISSDVRGMTLFITVFPFFSEGFKDNRTHQIKEWHIFKPISEEEQPVSNSQQSPNNSDMTNKRLLKNIVGPFWSKSDDLHSPHFSCL